MQSSSNNKSNVHQCVWVLDQIDTDFLDESVLFLLGMRPAEGLRIIAVYTKWQVSKCLSSWTEQVKSALTPGGRFRVVWTVPCLQQAFSSPLLMRPFWL